MQELSLESELITIGEKDYTEGKFGATEYITVEKAKEIAVAHAGVSPSRVECEFDRDDGRYVYEIEFKVGRYEYEYEIDAQSGEVVKYDKEYDD